MAVVWPETEDQLAELVRYARTHGIRLTPYGAGSAVTGAITLERDTIAVDMKRMRRLHSVDVAGGVAEADTGVLGEHLEQALQAQGATLGHFPSSIYCSTLGGWIATRSAGQCSGRYGKIEDMVLSLRGVLPTGETFASRAPLPGAVDTRALLVGSEGLFGFFTRARLRIWPAPTQRRFSSFTFDTMPSAWNAIRAIYQCGLRPAVARLYDPFDSYIFRSGARSHGHAPRSRPAPSKLAEFVNRRVLSHPGWLNSLNRRWGSQLFGRCLLVLVFEGTEHDALGPADARARALALDLGGLDQGEAPARRWLQRRHSVSYRQPPMYEQGLWVDTMEVAAPWSRLGDLYDGVHHALGSAGFVMAHMSHAYPDGCSIYFTFAGACADDHRALEHYTAVWERALIAAHRSGGTIAHHHGVGRSKRSAMRLELGAGVDLIAELTRAADPGEIIVRGPLVPARGEGPAPMPALAPPAPPFALDSRSRLATVRTDLPLAEVHDHLRRHGLSLPGAPGDGTVGEWLALQEVPVVARDPVDHPIAGWSARTPEGTVARALPSPRRAAGPDLLALYLPRASPFGTLESVTLRVRGADETGPAWTAPCTETDRGADAALDAWLDRARPDASFQRPLPAGTRTEES